MIVGQIGAGVSIDDLLADYPYLVHADVLQALRYAAWLAASSSYARRICALRFSATSFSPPSLRSPTYCSTGHS